MIITYIILQALLLQKYSSVIFTSNLWKFYDILYIIYILMQYLYSQI